MTRASAIIPAYNSEATLAAAIDSALAQKFDGGFEVVVVDDGSTDSTPRILERYRSKIRVVTQPNRGLSGARNAGVASSRSEYFAFLDADDEWLPDHLARAVAALERNSRATLSFCDARLIDEHGIEIESMPTGRAPTMDDLLHGAWRIFPSGVVMRRWAFEACGGFCEEFPSVGFEDLYMWMRAREHGEFEYVPERLLIYRAPPFISRFDKYRPAHKVFRRLVRERYGKAVRPLLHQIASAYAPVLVQKALWQIDQGDVRGAMLTGVRLLRLKPTHLFDRRYAGRFLRRRSLKRAAAVFRRRPKASSPGVAG